MPKKKEKEEQTLDEKLKNAIVPKDEEPYQVPDNWVWTRLGKISEKISKGTTPRGGEQAYTNNGIKFLRVENISDDYRIDTLNIKYVTEEIHNGFLKRSILEENDLLISIAGSLGKTAIVSKENLPLNTNQAIAFVRFINKEKYVSKYFAYFFNSNIIKKSLLSQTKVTAIPNLTLEVINNTKVALPPIEEQKRIVEKLDYFFDKIQKVKEIIEEVKEKNQARKESILSKAFTGELTAKWRTDNIHSAKELLNKINDEKLASWEIECKKAEEEGRKKPTKPKLKSIDEMIVPNDEIPYKIPDNWIWTRLKNVNEVITGGTPSKKMKEYWENKDINFVKPSDLYQSRNLNFSEEYVDIRAKEKVKMIPKGSTILCCIGSVGKSAFNEIECCTNQQINSLIPKKEILNPLYNFYYSNSQYFKNQMQNSSSATTIAILNKSKTEELYFPLPPIEEQKEIVRILDNIFSKENMISELISLEDKIQVLEKSILDKAFRGELGTNSSNDIDAIELLKNILQK